MYKPISEYGIIGNCRSAALVSDEGSIDWACLPDFDSQTYFCSILDDKKGGYFKISPTGFYQTHQKYRKNSNILKTYFFNHSGSISLTDFMPFTREEDKSNSPCEYGLRIVRKVKSLFGNHKIELILKVTPDYAKAKIDIIQKKNCIVIKCPDAVVVLYFAKGNVIFKNGAAYITLNLRNEEELFFGLGFYEKTSKIPSFSHQDFKAKYQKTQEFWEWWSSLCKYKGRFAQEVLRSALILKLLTFSPTGAIVAAPTTSLPEKLKGSLNWDYRYTWLRDASFTIYAFLGLGYMREAENFINWLERVCLKEGSMLKIMYGIRGEEELKELELGHLEGYMGSKPVRVGNGAAIQKQFDIFGEVLTGINLYLHAGGNLNEAMKNFVKRLVDYCCIHWREKDAGIWESRGGYKHNTYSKLMCWVGIERGINIARRLNINADLKYWEYTKGQIKKEILDRGYNEKLGSFVAYYNSKVIDTSTLNIPLFGLLPVNDHRVLSTIDKVMRRLIVDWFVLRTGDSKNELTQGEGTFFLSTFWLIDCLTMLGRFEEAKVWLEKIIHDSTYLGLYAEEFDPVTKQHLGNFPQAFTHLGFVNSVLNLHQAQIFGADAKQSTQSDRLVRILHSLSLKQRPIESFLPFKVP